MSKRKKTGVVASDTPLIRGPTIGWKLFTLRKDGTIGPLFINRKLKLLDGEWFEAEDHPTKGYARRPGWHVTPRPRAPHLKTDREDRVWRRVMIMEYTELERPEKQGGTWWLANRMMVLPPLEYIEEQDYELGTKQHNDLG